MVETDNSQRATVAETERLTHDVSTRGVMVHADLKHRAATLVVGESEASVEIEVTPTGPFPGDYFVGTFDGPRMTALVHLGEDYDVVQKIDLIHMVEAQQDVGDFPCIAVVGSEEERRLVVVGGGVPARLELYPLPDFVAQPE